MRRLMITLSILFRGGLIISLKIEILNHQQMLSYMIKTFSPYPVVSTLRERGFPSSKFRITCIMAKKPNPSLNNK